MIAPAARSHIPALDGLRGCAVLLVMAYHCEVVGAAGGSTLRLLTGGWIGVDIFFVLSGYLITSGLLRAPSNSKTYGLRAFYLRRLRRLGPALALLLGIWLALSLTGVVDVVQLGDTSRQGSAWLAITPVVGVLTLGYNWWLADDRPSPVGMGHLWSLTIEEQFYLVWPGLVHWASRRGDARRRLLGWCALGALVAFGLSVLAAETGRRDIAYFGTPTRMFGLLLGAAVAIKQQLPPSDTAPSSRRALDRRVTALGAIAVIVAMSLGVPDASRSLVPLASVVTAACAALLVRYLVTVEQAGTNWFANGWLRWCGTRSYALYLWDAPAVFVCERVFGVSLQSGAISAVAAFGCAHISWMLVERRFLSTKSATTLPKMSAAPAEVIAR